MKLYGCLPAMAFFAGFLANTEPVRAEAGERAPDRGFAKASPRSLELTTYPFSDPDPIPATNEPRYPYFRYDGASAEGRSVRWNAIDLENDSIRVTMMPDVGGKIWGAVDKRSGRAFIYFNHSAKFRDIATRGPWTSGGVEFNFGIIGHAPCSSTPVDWTVRTNGDESVSFFSGAIDFVTRSYWQVETRLPAKADGFETRVCWYNASGLPQPYYHWMNAAFPIGGNPRFLFPGSTYVGHEGDAHAWPIDGQGRDLSEYRQNAFGGNKSYHVLPGANAAFGIWWPEWSLGAFHRNLPWEKYGRKIWLWALSREGAIWENYLTDRDGQYAELQSGRYMLQPRRANYATPFKHPAFDPGATERFSEFWGVVHSLDALTNLVRETDRDFIPRPAVAPADFDWDSAYGRCVRAEQWLRDRRDAEAERCFRESLECEPLFVPSLTGLAKIEMRRGAYAKCHELCSKALSVDTTDEDANYIDGYAYFAEGNFVTARERLGVAAFGMRCRSAAYALIARSLVAEGLFAEAREAAAVSLSCNDANFDALLVEAIARRRLTGDRGFASSLCERFPLYPAFRYEAEGSGFVRGIRNELPGQTILEVGSWYQESGLADDAARIFRLAPRDPIARIRLAFLLGDETELAAAAELPARGVFPFRRETLPALRWAAAKSDHWRFGYYLGVLLAAFHLDEEAALALTACDRADEAVALVFRARQRAGAARRADLLRARSLGDSWRIGLDLCRSYCSAGEHAAYLRTAEDCVRRYPEVNSVKIAYADALLKNGKFRECMDYLGGISILPSEYGDNATDIWQAAQKALGLEPTYPEALGKGEPYR